MKTVVEFGTVCGRVSQHICQSEVEGWKLADSLAWVLGRSTVGWALADFQVSQKRPAVTWQSEAHFVSVRLFTSEDQAKEDAYRAEEATWAMRP